MGLNKIKINDVTTINTGVVYDISKATGQTYETLADALGTDGNNVPLDIREGGMSVRFVHKGDNKYLQYRLMSDTFNTTPANWQGVDEEPTAGSENLVKSGGTINSAFRTIELSQSLLNLGYFSLNKDTFGLLEGYYGFNTERGVVFYPDSVHRALSIDISGTIISKIGLKNGFPNPALANIYYKTVSEQNRSIKVQNDDTVDITDDIKTLYLNFYSLEVYPNTTFDLYSPTNNLKNNLPLLSKLQIVSSKGVENTALYDLLGVQFNINAYINQNGVQISTIYWRATDYIPVVEGDIVNYRTYAQANASAAIALYDKDKNFVASDSVLPTENGIVESELTIPANICYFRSCVPYNSSTIDYNTCYCTINSIMSLKERLNKFVSGDIDDSIENYLNTTKVKANQISEEYYNENTDVELVDSGLNNQYYSQSGTSIEIKDMSNLGSLFAINVIEGRKYHLKLMQEVDPSVYKAYFIFAIDNTTAAIQNTEISQYVKSIDTQNYIWEITIPQGCTKVITAGYKSTFGSFWIKELAKESLEWLLVNEDNLSEELKEKINESGGEQEEIDVLQTQMSKVDNTLHLFDSIKKPITFNGKTLVAFGDSITHGVSSPNLQPAGENKYISLFCNYVGCTLNNQAVSGACITNGMVQITSIHDKILSFTGNADIIWIAGGINDWQTQALIGTYNDTGNTTLYGALKEICSFLKTNYPDAVVIFITPIPTTSTTTFGKQHPDNLNLYRKAIQEIAAVNGFNVINGADLGLPDEMTSYGNAMFDDSDRVHPTIAGHALYARSLTGKLL